MGDDIYTKRPISHDEARAIADRLIASHFRKHDSENARITIPADPERDDDLLIGAYILQQRAATAERDAAVAREAVCREALDNAEAVMSIVEPRSDKAEYLRCLKQIRSAVATPSQRADAMLACVRALRDLIPACKTEINEKGAGGFLLARLSDAESAIRLLDSN